MHQTEFKELNKVDLRSTTGKVARESIFYYIYNLGLERGKGKKK